MIVGADAADEPAHILVAADDPRLAAFLDRALRQAGYRVELAANADRALAAARSGAHDLVLLDLADPPHAARDLAGQLRAEHATPILLLSACTAIQDRVAALDVGADDVLVKPFALLELLARLRALRRGRELAVAQVQGGLGQRTLTYADVELDPLSREATRGGRPLALRRLTFELLAYFLRAPERVISRQELLEQVWRYPPLGEPADRSALNNLVDVTVSRLRRALEAGGEPRLLHTVRPIGYILRARLGRR
jgi:DNA-binding response OmpR family regulator